MFLVEDNDGTEHSDYNIVRRYLERVRSDDSERKQKVSGGIVQRKAVDI